MKRSRGKKIKLEITVGYADEGQAILDEIKKRAGANKKGAGTKLADYVLDRIFKKDRANPPLPAFGSGRMAPNELTEPRRINYGGSMKIDRSSVVFDVDENTEDPMPRVHDMSQIPAGKPR